MPLRAREAIQSGFTPQRTPSASCVHPCSPGLLAGASRAPASQRTRLSAHTQSHASTCTWSVFISPFPLDIGSHRWHRYLQYPSPRARGLGLCLSLCAPLPRSGRLGFHRPAEAQWVAGAPAPPPGAAPRPERPPHPPLLAQPRRASGLRPCLAPRAQDWGSVRGLQGQPGVIRAAGPGSSAAVPRSSLLMSHGVFIHLFHHWAKPCVQDHFSYQFLSFL